MQVLGTSFAFEVGGNEWPPGHQGKGGFAMKSDSPIKTSPWQLVFSQSKANGAHYDGEKLPTFPWHWPKDTFLQRRRQVLKNARASESPAETSNGVFYESICSDYARSGSSDPYYKPTVSKS
jgi:hypothetical protein